MIWFLVIVIGLIAFFLLWLLQPYFRAQKAAVTSRNEINLTVYQDQIAKIDQDVVDGLLAPSQAKASIAEIQQRLLQETADEPIQAGPHSSRATVLVISICLPIFALAFYGVVGTPEAMMLEQRLPQQGRVQQPDIEKMVASLAKKLEQEPDNLQGWAMLGRSYKVLGNTVEAEKAYDRAGSFLMTDAQLLADYADVAVANAQGDFSGKPIQLIERALKVDAKNPMALWLAGSAAMQARNAPKAIGYFQRLLAVLPPDSEDAKMIQETIAQIKAARP